MGGGDLNMKKSWHPQRLDNQEEVWKREMKEKKERQKMIELKRQLQEERDLEEMKKRGEDSGTLKKKKDRVDWMYNQPKVNEEDYLMGKKVDKAIMEHQQTKTKEASSGGGSGLIVDMAAKVKEDPLFAIKKQEINHKKALMNNPIRMKQLQQMLKAQVGAKEKSKKSKKSKAPKKHKKSRRQSSTDSESESDSEIEHIRRKKKKMDRRRDSSESSDEPMRDRRKESKRSKERRHFDDSDSEHEQRKERRRREERNHERRNFNDSDLEEERKGDRRKKERSNQERRNFHDGDSEEERRRDRRKNDRKNKDRRDLHDSDSELDRRIERRKEERKSRRRRYSSDESDDVRTKKSSSSRLDEHKKKIPPGYGLIGGHKAPRRHRESSSESDHTPSNHPRHGDRHRGRRSRSRSPIKQRKPKKMDAEELERRRAEMMDNAKWRDEQRKDRVSRYNAEERAETEMEKKKTKDAKFLETMRLPSNSSVEDQIKRNVFSIQRTNAALDKNFARR
ncbi:pre-mRNA-splicing factor CWC25 homolog [Lytechinus variegatus]|uniref:pre-mRNA-splicing factor CWC25 homolog n=1 Tax=Lytechinus variegatus TaxID=7654 RepID=UPI001BB10723|nr:pre-mRNA-splicing factor CWC25 homolog [Lytechinus variegatus]